MFFRRNPPADDGELQRLRQAHDAVQQQLAQAREQEAALAAELSQARAAVLTRIQSMGCDPACLLG